MITTLTLNPSIDRTVMLEALRVGEVQRVLESRLEPAGKGVNIARALGINGTAAEAVFPVEPAAQQAFRDALEPHGVICHTVQRSEATRTNLSITEADGTTTKLNESGAPLAAEVLETLLELTARGEQDGLIAASGSIPSGVEADVYVTLARRLGDPARSLAVDTSGAALTAMVGVPCAVAKPNLEELQSLVESPLESLGDVIDAAAALRRGGWSAVLVSLGEDGAVLVDDSGVYHGRADVDAVLNTVGAGDSMLAGYLSACDAGDTPSAALAEALAWSHAAVSSPGTGLPPISARNREAVALAPTVEPQSRVGAHVGGHVREGFTAPEGEKP